MFRCLCDLNCLSVVILVFRLGCLNVDVVSVGILYSGPSKTL